MTNKKKEPRDKGNIEDFKTLGCSDGGCCIYKPTGMHTNGGCRCLRDPDKNNFLAKKLAHYYREEVIKLREENKALREDIQNKVI